MSASTYRHAPTMGRMPAAKPASCGLSGTPAAADSGPVDSYGASAVGRRKSAVANVIVRPGQGVFTINDRELIDYFVRDTHRDHVIQPFEFTDTLCDFDVTCRVHGGGLSGARARRDILRFRELDNIKGTVNELLLIKKNLRERAIKNNLFNSKEYTKNLADTLNMVWKNFAIE